MSRDQTKVFSIAVLLALAAGAQTTSPARSATDSSNDPCGNSSVESSLWYPVDGKVIKVEDGSTVLIMSTEGRVRVHLVGIAVEQKGALADEAKARVSELSLNKGVGVLVSDGWLYLKKKPGEITGVVQLKDGAGFDVGLSLVAAGLARAQKPPRSGDQSEIRQVGSLAGAVEKIGEQTLRLYSPSLVILSVMEIYRQPI